MKKSTSTEAFSETVQLPSAITANTAREGIRRFLPMAAMLASLTKTDVDDKGVQLLSAIVNSDEVFAAIVNLLPKGEGGTAPAPID